MSDVEALALANRTLTSATPAERQFALAVTRMETGYGKGWPASDPLAQQSHNWGAVQAFKGTSMPVFPHIDHHADGKEYVALFRFYPNDEAGLADAARIILKPNVKAAIARGDGVAAVHAMHDNHYFEANVDRYAAGVAKNYAALIHATGAPALLSFAGGSSGASGSSAPSSASGISSVPGSNISFAKVLGVGVLAWLGWHWWQKDHEPKTKGRRANVEGDE
jgi:hypothetical protein